MSDEAEGLVYASERHLPARRMSSRTIGFLAAGAIISLGGYFAGTLRGWMVLIGSALAAAAVGGLIAAHRPADSTRAFRRAAAAGWSVVAVGEDADHRDRLHALYSIGGWTFAVERRKRVKRNPFEPDLMTTHVLLDGEEVGWIDLAGFASGPNRERLREGVVGEVAGHPLEVRQPKRGIRPSRRGVHIRMGDRRLYLDTRGSLSEDQHVHGRLTPAPARTTMDLPLELGVLTVLLLASNVPDHLDSPLADLNI